MFNLYIIRHNQTGQNLGYDKSPLIRYGVKYLKIVINGMGVYGIP